MDGDLDQEGPEAEHQRRHREGPQRNDGQGDQGRQHDGPAPADALGEGAEDQPAHHRAEVQDDGQGRDHARGEVVLHPQEGRIEVLGAVAEEVEAGHHHHDVGEQQPLAAHGAEEAAMQLSLGLRLMPRRLPGRGFGHVAADVEDQQGRQGAQAHQPAPADVRQEQVGDGRQEVAHRITFLQDAGDHAAAFCRNGLQRQRSADAPLAAHGKAEQAPQDQQHRQVRREGRGDGQGRIEGHVDHQDRAASVVVGQAAEDQGAEGPGRQGQQQGDADVRDLDRMAGGRELLGDVGQDEGQEEVVEGVEGPAEQGGDEGRPLDLIQRLQLVDDDHAGVPLSPQAIKRRAEAACKPGRFPELSSRTGRGPIPDRRKRRRLLRSGLCGASHLRRG